LYELCGAAEALAELGGGLAVAGDAEGAEVVEVALAAAFDDGEDVVGVPEGASAGDGFHAVKGEAGDAGFAAGAFEGGVDGGGVGAAELADAVVAGEDLVAEVAGVGAETPLVDTEVGAEGTAAFGEDFELAPAAEGPAVFAAGEDVGADASAWKCARNHDLMRIGCFSRGRE
jgi:hypothetical protein